jgi:hypothetical protein
VNGGSESESHAAIPAVAGLGLCRCCSRLLPFSVFAVRSHSERSEESLFAFASLLPFRAPRCCRSLFAGARPFGVKGRSSAFLAAAFAFRCHPEPIRAWRGWVRDLLLSSSRSCPSGCPTLAALQGWVFKEVQSSSRAMAARNPRASAFAVRCHPDRAQRRGTSLLLTHSRISTHSRNCPRIPCLLGGRRLQLRHKLRRNSAFLSRRLSREPRLREKSRTCCEPAPASPSHPHAGNARRLLRNLVCSFF